MLGDTRDAQAITIWWLSLVTVGCAVVVTVTKIAVACSLCDAQLWCMHLVDDTRTVVVHGFGG